MKEQILVLKEHIASMEREIEEKEKADFLKGPHKTFNLGDWVTDGEQIGVVEWVENNACKCPESNGYMGVSLKNGNLGFLAFAKRNDFSRLEEQEYNYYTGTMNVSLNLSGEEIEQLLSIIRSQHNSPAVIKIKRTLELIRDYPNLSETE